MRLKDSMGKSLFKGMGSCVMRGVLRSAARGRRALRASLAVIATGAFVFLSAGSALADPPPAPVPPVGAAPSVSGPSVPGPGTGQAQPPVVNGLIDPALLGLLQPSIVGLVTVWEEPVDPYGMVAPQASPPPEPTASSKNLPVFSICTGWFATPTTIVTAGHCVDPKVGRQAMHEQNGPRDENGWLLPLDRSLPEPNRTVWAFQPRELPGAVLTSPVIVQVDNFRSDDDGDTAKLNVYGQPPAKPLAIAANPPQVGETVTSIGFPGMNITETDGIDVNALLSGSKSPAEVLQESRLHAVNTSGTIGSRQYRHGVAVSQVNADLSFGMSGGPTINSRGEVLGVNSKAKLRKSDATAGATAAGDHALAVGRDLKLYADRGSAAALTMGPVTIGGERPDPHRPGQPQS
jgi:Trypsin-like peptidase domain